MFEAYATLQRKQITVTENTQIVKMVIAECAEIGIDIKHPRKYSR